MIPALNFHLTQMCNMHCKFCHSRFEKRQRLTLDQQKQIIAKAVKAGIDKINFVGGEPLLLKDLPQLIHYAKSLNVVTSIVTNGVLLDEDFLQEVAKSLDIIGLSVDSLNSEVNRRLGRCTTEICPDEEFYRSKVELIKKYGFYLKINTVVTTLNYRELLADFIVDVQPIRWKVFEMMTVQDVNDKSAWLKPSRAQFNAFIELNKKAQKFMIPESEEVLQHSYIMIDPYGYPFYNLGGKYFYLNRVVENDFDATIEQLPVRLEYFLRRDGDYFYKLRKKQLA